MKKIFKGIFTMALVSILFMGGAKAYSTSDIVSSRNNSTYLKSASGVQTDKVIPKEYSFSMGVKKNAVQTEYSGVVDAKNALSNYADTVSSCGMSRGTPSLAKGSVNKYSILYKGVDIYNEKLIDVKATVIGYEAISGHEDTAILFLDTAWINNCNAGIKWVKIKYDFLEHGTNKAVNVKGYTGYWDIDGNQGVIIDNNNTGIYITGSAANKAINSKNGENVLKIASIGSAKYIFADNVDIKSTFQDPDAAFTETFSGSSLTRTYTYGNPGTTWTKADGGISNYSESAEPVELLKPTKKVNKTTVKPGEEYEYTITQKVNNEISSRYFKSFKIEDTLENVLEASASKVTVKNIKGEDVTNNFDIAVSGQKISITPKSLTTEGFYGDTYTVTIKTKVKADADLSSYKDYIIPNHATRTYTDYENKGHTENTDIVNVKVEPYKLIVHHLEEGTDKKLADDETYEKKYNESYSTNKSDKVIKDGYELVSTPSNANGTITKDTEVTYYYKKQSSIVVNVPKTMANISKALLGIGVIAVIVSGVVIYKNTKKNK